MAVFKRLTQANIENNYTHYARFFGVVPIYFNADSPAALVAVRNWWPEWTLDLAMVIFDMLCRVREMTDPNWEYPGFPITLVRPIKVPA